MIGHVLSTALKDYVRPQRLFAWSAVVVVVFLISKIWGILAADLAPAESFDRVYQAVVLRVAALAMAVFGTMVVSQEVEQKTIVYILTRPLPRWKTLVGRMLAASTVSFAVALLALLAAGLGVLGLGVFSDGRLFVDAAVLAVGTLAYCGFFVWLSLVLPKSLIVSLLFAFGWETFVPNMPGDMYYISVLTYLRSAAPHAVVAGGPSLGDVVTGALAPKTLEAPQAWTVLALLVLAGWAVCVWKFSRFEYSPREESA